jgi:hypothetical protein
MKENMRNYCGTKIPLWIKGDVFTLCYYGIYTMQSVGQIWIPQCGLDRPQNVISIILPSGREKLDTVRPKHDHSWTNADKTTWEHLFGIALKKPRAPLVAADYAYTDAGKIRAAIRGDRLKGSRIYFEAVQGGTGTKLFFSCSIKD